MIDITPAGLSALAIIVDRHRNGLWTGRNFVSPSALAKLRRQQLVEDRFSFDHYFVKPTEEGERALARHREVVQ
jgi:hypothetical protein